MKNTREDMYNTIQYNTLLTTPHRGFSVTIHMCSASKILGHMTVTINKEFVCVLY